MARSVTLLGSLISDCEATSNANGSWSTGTVQDVHVRAGTYALGIKVSQATSARIEYTYTSSYDATDEAFLIHLQVDGTVDTRANGGFRLYVEDTSGNWKEWWFGKEDVISDFVPLMVHPSNTADVNSSSGTLDITAIKVVGITFKVISKALGNNSNSFWDQAYWVGGVRCTSLSTDAVTIEEIYDDVFSSAWGAMLNIDGVIFCQAPIYFGDTSTASVDIVSSGEVINWIQRPTVAGWYKIELEGNATGTTDVDIAGGFFRAGTSDFDMVFDNTNLDTVSLSGTTIQGAGTCSFGTSQDVDSCVFDNCDMVDPNLATFENNKVINSKETGAGTGALYLPLTNNVDLISFAGNDRDILIDQPGTYNNESFTHGTNTFDIDYNNASNATFNVPSDGDTSTVTNTGTGTMTIVAGQVIFSFTVDPSFTGYEWRIYSVTAAGSLAGAVELDGEETATQDNQSYTYTYTSDTPIAVQILSSTYEESVTYYTLSTLNQSIAIPLEVDNND